MNISLPDLIYVLLTINFLRYLLTALPVFLIFYVLKKRAWRGKKIQVKFPHLNDYQREISYSIITMVIFSMVGVLVIASPLHQFNLVYDEVALYGWGYWGLSILLMIFLHDTYFYWMHRLMHQPKLFKYFHLVHHKSTNPSPWAAYAFHPLEAVIEASIIFLIVFMIPHHRTALLTFLTFMIIYNVYGHLGYELYPKRFNKHFIGRWVNTSVNHNLHHKHFEGNYGLYFLIWDRLLGTVRQDYDESYEQVDQQRSERSHPEHF